VLSNTAVGGHPPLARNPPNRSPALHVDEFGGFIRRQGVGPRIEPHLSKFVAFGVRAAKRSLKLLAATQLQLVTNRLEHKLAPILLKAIDSAHDFGWQGDSDALVCRHGDGLNMIIP